MIEGFKFISVLSFGHWAVTNYGRGRNIYTTNFVPKWKTSARRLAFPHVKLPEQSGLTSSRSCVLLCGCSCLNLSGHVIGLLGGKGAVLCFLPCTAFPSKVAKNTLKNQPRRQILVGFRESSHKGEPVVND